MHTHTHCESTRNTHTHTHTHRHTHTWGRQGRKRSANVEPVHCKVDPDTDPGRNRRLVSKPQQTTNQRKMSSANMFNWLFGGGRRSSTGTRSTRSYSPRLLRSDCTFRLQVHDYTTPSAQHGSGSRAHLTVPRRDRAVCVRVELREFCGRTRIADGFFLPAENAAAMEGIRPTSKRRHSTVSMLFRCPRCQSYDKPDFLMSNISRTTSTIFRWFTEPKAPDYGKHFLTNKTRHCPSNKAKIFCGRLMIERTLISVCVCVGFRWCGA